MKIEIEGVEITPNTMEILKKWLTFNPVVEEPFPEIYIRDLNNMQDYFCRQLEEDSREELRDMILSVIAIKDDLKQFVKKRK